MRKLMKWQTRTSCFLKDGEMNTAREEGASPSRTLFHSPCTRQEGRHTDGIWILPKIQIITLLSGDNPGLKSTRELRLQVRPKTTGFFGQAQT